MQGADDDVLGTRGDDGRELEDADLALPSLFADVIDDDAPLSTEELAALLGDVDAAADNIVAATAAAGPPLPPPPPPPPAVAPECSALWTRATLLTHHPQRSTAVPTGTRVVTKKHSSRNSNKARDGRKEELAYLRRSVAELETRLQALTATAQREASARTEPRISHNGLDLSNSTRHSPLTLPAHRDSKDAHSDMWREIAQRQSDERYRSERENVRLRVVLESQLKVARSLEKFLQLKTAAATTVRACGHLHRLYGSIDWT